jgi:hypothetical protein
MPQPDPFDPDSLRGPGIDPAALQPRPARRPPRHKPGEPFLKGPIPWPWLTTAARLPGKALHVALVLWREAGCRKSRTVRFCLSHGDDLGVSEQAARRALRGMERAGLVSLLRKPGRGLEVTLLDLAGEQRDDGGRE